VLCTAGSPREWKRLCKGEARKTAKEKPTAASSSTNRKRRGSEDQAEERLQRTGREDGSKLPLEASTSPPPPPPRVEQVSTPPERGGDGSYAEKRLVNIQQNQDMMEKLGIAFTKRRKHDEGGARVPFQKQNHSDVVVSTYNSPTRKNLEILVVLGGEIHCNSPVHVKTFNLFLPLSSERVNKLLVWKGMEAVLR